MNYERTRHFVAINTEAEVKKFAEAARMVEGYCDFIDQSKASNAEVAILTYQSASEPAKSEAAVKMLMKGCAIKGELTTCAVSGKWVYVVGLNLKRAA